MDVVCCSLDVGFDCILQFINSETKKSHQMNIRSAIINATALLLLVLLDISNACSDANCRTCSNPAYCDSCLGQYGPNNGVCVQCNTLVSKCIWCWTDANYCVGCEDGFGSSSGLCYRCSRTNCQICTENPNICTTCSPRYRVQSGGCARCTDTQCLTCHSGVSVCTACDTGFGVSLGSCSPCTDTNCLECSLNKLVCTACDTGYGVSSGVCSQCTNQNCLECSANNAYCTACGGGLGAQSGNCVSCTSSSCLNCSSSPSVCTACDTGFGVSSGSCSPCTDTNCLECSLNVLVCTACDTGFGASSGSCSPCTDASCLECSLSSSVCTACDQGFGVQAGSCTTCDDTQCLECAHSSIVCTACDTGFGVSSGSCSSCAETNCSNCSLNHSYCYSCQAGLGLVDGACEPCIDDNCIDCQYLANQCLACSAGYGVQSTYCGLCSDSNCLLCSEDFSNCTSCQLGYGLSSGTCNPCTDGNCTECSTDPNICNECAEGTGLGLSVGPNCFVCDSVCLTCSHFLYNNCTSCGTGMYLFSDTCNPCSQNCITCTNSISCQACEAGFYVSQDLATSTAVCSACPALCNTCSMNNVYSSIQCATCIAGAYELDHSTPPVCRELCGDSITTVYPCDNPISVPYDGCNNDCQVEDDFMCSLVAGTICSYNGTMDINFVQFKRSGTENKFDLVIKIFPPLDLFRRASVNQLKQIFQIKNPNMEVQIAKFDASSGQLTLTIQYTADISDLNIVLEIVQHGGTPVEFVTPAIITMQCGTNKIYYYSAFAIGFAKSGIIIYYVIVALGWLSLILGLILRKLAGLQSIFILQFAWVITMWLNQTLHLPYQSLSILKYTSAYNHNFIITNQTTTNTAPYTSQFHTDGLLFLNNYNIGLIFVLLCWIGIGVNWVRLKKVKNIRSVDLKEEKTTEANQTCRQVIKEEKDHKVDKIKSKLSIIIEEKQQNMQKDRNKLKINIDQKLLQNQAQKLKIYEHYEYSLQLTLYISLFNLINYASSCVLYFKQGTLPHVASLILVGIGLISYVGILYKFHNDAYSFDYFRNSFKKQTLANRHYYIQIVFVPVVAVLIPAVYKYIWSVFIPCVGMLIYLLIYRPYKYIGQNLRASFNILVLCCWLGFSTVAPLFPNSTLSYMILIVDAFVLLPLIVIISIISSIYYYYYETYVLPIQLQENLKKAVTEEEQIRRKILEELDFIDVTKYGNELKGSILSGFLSPKTSLLNLSNRLKTAQELQQTKRKAMENCLNKSSIPISAETPTPLIKNADKVTKKEFGKKRRVNRNGQEYSEYSSVGSVKKQTGQDNIELTTLNICDKKNSPNNIAYTHKNTNPTQKNPEQQVTSKTNPNLSSNKTKKDTNPINQTSENPKTKTKAQLQRQIMEKIAMTQNKLIKYRAAQQYVIEQMIAPKPAQYDELIEAYDGINMNFI